MSLAFKKSLKRYIPKVIFAIFLILLVIFFTRVYIWEQNYLKEKEGSERAIPEVVGDIDSEVTDEIVTEQQQLEYTVAPDKPRYIHINKLNISHARIFEVGVNRKGQMKTPSTNYDAGWYTGSDKPGTGGTAILNGHNGGPNSYGIFKKLNTLSSGDLIRIEMGDGTMYTYRVYDNFEVQLSEANEKMSMLATSPIQNEESISIISCVGEWSLKQKTYLSRQFLRATRI